MLGRRVRYNVETVDCLEGRSLLSTLFSPQCVHLPTQDDMRRASAYAETSVEHPAVHATYGGGNLAVTLRIAHTAEPSGGTSAAVKAATASVVRRDVVVSTTDRPISLADSAIAGRPGLLPVEPSPATASDMGGLAPINANDTLLSLTSSLGWAPGTTARGSFSVLSGSDWNETPGQRSPIGFGLMMMSGWPGHFRVGTDSLSPGGRSWPGRGVDELERLAIVTTASDLDVESPAGAELLRGGPMPDWESIDQELRHLLMRMGGLVEDGPTGVGGRNWLIGIVSGAVATLAHRAARSARRRRSRGGALDAIPALSVGPWPMSQS